MIIENIIIVEVAELHRYKNLSVMINVKLNVKCKLDFLVEAKVQPPCRWRLLVYVSTGRGGFEDG